jgi:hypothetical protein
MTVQTRLRCLAAAAAAMVMLGPATIRLAAQDARAIVLEPGAVNASTEGASWWLANESIVVTWSTAGGGIRLASVYDRLGGRTAPKPGETFTITLPAGNTLGGSAFQLDGSPSVADLPPSPSAGGSPTLKPASRFRRASGAPTAPSL